MITSVILSFASTLTPMATGTQSGAAISTATNPTRAQTAQQKKAPRLIRDLNGKVLGDEATADLALGGDFYNPFVGRRSATAYLYGTWEVTLNDTGTAWQEKFLIGLPRHPQWPTPMLVAFHGWGSTQEDIIIRTRYFQKAMARGWVVVAPLGAHQFNYSIDYSQKNTEAVLDWVMSYFAIDSDRIYGVGFSMGGGSVSTYAARHQDPTHARFAAIVDHTGTVSIRDIWTHALDKSLLEHELMFEGSPMQVPFRYQSASVIDLDASGQIDPNADLARNLIRTPVKVFAVAGDPNAHLVEESIDFHGHLTGLGGTPQLEIDPGTTHRWTNLPEDEALDWLQQYRLVERAFGTVAYCWQGDRRGHPGRAQVVDRRGHRPRPAARRRAAAGRGAHPGLGARTTVQMDADPVALTAPGRGLRVGARRAGVAGAGRAGRRGDRGGRLLARAAQPRRGVHGPDRPPRRAGGHRMSTTTRRPDAPTSTRRRRRRSRRC